MARQQRSTLPKITVSDIDQHQDMLRRTATGWAWKCAYCGQFASSETLTGKYVCRSHGGVTPRQRSPESRDTARQAGERVPQPPGRPLKSGLYSRRAKVRVDEIVADYQARQIDADNTDEDMLYLRAYLQALREEQPSVEQLATPLLRLKVQFEEQATADLKLGNSSRETANLLRQVERVLQDVTGYTGQLEKRHERLIKLSKVRAETRLKDHAAKQVEAFAMMVDRFQMILQEQLSAEDFAALQQRITRDLALMPAAVLDGSAGIRTSR